MFDIDLTDADRLSRHMATPMTSDNQSTAAMVATMRRYYKMWSNNHGATASHLVHSSHLL